MNFGLNFFRNFLFLGSPQFLPTYFFFSAASLAIVFFLVLTPSMRISISTKILQPFTTISLNFVSTFVNILIFTVDILSLLVSLTYLHRDFSSLINSSDAVTLSTLCRVVFSYTDIARSFSLMITLYTKLSLWGNFMSLYFVSTNILMSSSILALSATLTRSFVGFLILSSHSTTS